MYMYKYEKTQGVQMILLMKLCVCNINMGIDEWRKY